MRGYTQLFGILISWLVFSPSIYSETVLSSLEEIGLFGEERSFEVLQREISLREASHEKIPQIRLKDSSLSGSVQLDFSDGQADWEVAMSLPLLDQVSLSGSLDEDLNSVLGISLTPLAHFSARELSELQIRSSHLSLEKARLDGESQALSAALGWMKASRSEDILSQKVALAEISYKDNLERYGRGGISFDELQDSLIDWSDKRKEFSEAEQNLRQRERELFAFMVDDREQVIIPMLEIADLESSLSALKGAQSALTPRPENNSDWLLSIVEKDQLRTEWKHTWSYEPSLTAGAALAFGNDGSIAGSAAITFSLSPSDFQNRKRSIARDRYDLAAGEARSLRLETDLLLMQSLEAMESAEIISEIARLELVQTENLDSEAEYLLGTGDFSQLERESARIALKEAQDSLFAALADEYLVLIAMKAFY